MSAEQKKEGIASSEIDEIVKDISKLKEELQKNTAVDASPEQPVVAASDATHPVIEEGGENPSVDAGLQEFRGSSGDASLEETLGAMKEEAPPSGKSLLDVPAESNEAEVEENSAEPIEAVQAEVEEEVSRELKAVPTGTFGDSGEKENGGTLTLKLTGRMKLKLSYEYSGQEVTVCFDDDYLQVQMADGTEFKIPVQKKTVSSQAA